MKKTFRYIAENSLGVLSLAFIILNTIGTFIPVFFIGLLKLIPVKYWQKQCGRLLNTICTLWVSFNCVFFNKTRKIHWDIALNTPLEKQKWYLVIANHQSWLDILVLQKTFNHKIPMLKFFIKDSLKWVPFFGFAWWAIDCPFMKRYSKKTLQKNPNKRGVDLEATKKACKKFQYTPVTIMNFLEGTRLTKEKKLKQNSPYQHLLKPKAGGIALVLNIMGEKLTNLLDVTILYPHQSLSLWNYLCGRIHHIKVQVNPLSFPKKLTHSDYFNNKNTEYNFKCWINNHWQQKDSYIQTQLNN